MSIEWSILPRGDVAAQWSGVYVTMNMQGSIIMNRATYQRMGEPAAFLVLLDKLNSRIALKPSSASVKHSYPAGKRGRYGGRIVRAYRLLTEFGIKLPGTVEFKDAEIDVDGQLILDLRTARISPRAHSQARSGNRPQNS
jgi:hypothetical protein